MQRSIASGKAENTLYSRGVMVIDPTASLQYSLGFFLHIIRFALLGTAH